MAQEKKGKLKSQKKEKEKKWRWEEKTKGSLSPPLQIFTFFLCIQQTYPQIFIEYE